jgi:hypothetical protein
MHIDTPNENILFVSEIHLSKNSGLKRLKKQVNFTRCSLCRLLRLLSTWCHAAAFFSASGAALSQEVPTVK